MANAVYAAKRERSVGLGLMGFHTFLQAQNVPFESALAKSWNMRLFKTLRRQCDAASRTLAAERGPCPDAADRGVMERFSHKLAIAPTASISIICGGTSAGIEPIPANIYSHKTLSGTFAVKNIYLERILEQTGHNTPAVWDSILQNEGSVQHLDFLSQDDKDVYKTAFEIDQRWVVELAADRTPDVCQSQSVNIFLPGDVDKWDLHMLHWQAWGAGVQISVLPAVQVGAAGEPRRGRDPRGGGHVGRGQDRLRGMPGLPIGGAGLPQPRGQRDCRTSRVETRCGPGATGRSLSDDIARYLKPAGIVGETRAWAESSRLCPERRPMLTQKTTISAWLLHMVRL